MVYASCAWIVLYVCLSIRVSGDLSDLHKNVCRCILLVALRTAGVSNETFVYSG